MYIKKTTLNAIKTEAIRLYGDKKITSFALFCHINEGSFCFFIDHSIIDSFDCIHYSPYALPGTRLSKPLTIELINQIGFTYIEHAPNNCVKLKFSINETKVQCEIDGGKGWIKLPFKK